MKIAQPAVFAQAGAQALTLRAESVAMVTNGLNSSPCLLLFLKVRFPTSIELDADDSGRIIDRSSRKNFNFILVMIENFSNQIIIRSQLRETRYSLNVN